MNKPKLNKPKLNMKSNAEGVIDQKALLFGLISVFLCGIGFGIVAPIVPFLVRPYTSNANEQAVMVTLLMSAYAACVFFAAPVMGALSDRYGRRPLLLMSLLGSAVGYIIFGIGGSLTMLFVGRVIEGLTGGSVSTIFAYFADITPAQQRSKYFGWVSAVSGAGFILGPALGGLISKWGYAAPMYFGAGITLLNVLYGSLFMPETLPKERRLEAVTVIKLNPISQLRQVFREKELNRLLLSAFLMWVPNGALQAVFSQFTLDTFKWEPTIIGLVFSIMGLQDILAQGFVMPSLIKRMHDRQIVRLGMLSEILGYGLFAASAVLACAPLFIVGMLVFGFGDAVFGPSFNGLLSSNVAHHEQGKIQGSCQSIQALARILGPLLGGQIYVRLGHAAPSIWGVIFIMAALLILKGSTTKSKKELLTSA